MGAWKIRSFPYWVFGNFSGAFPVQLRDGIIRTSTWYSFYDFCLGSYKPSTNLGGRPERWDRWAHGLSGMCETIPTSQHTTDILHIIYLYTLLYIKKLIWIHYGYQQISPSKLMYISLPKHHVLATFRVRVFVLLTTNQYLDFSRPQLQSVGPSRQLQQLWNCKGSRTWGWSRNESSPSAVEFRFSGVNGMMTWWVFQMVWWLGWLEIFGKNTQQLNVKYLLRVYEGIYIYYIYIYMRQHSMVPPPTHIAPVVGVELYYTCISGKPPQQAVNHSEPLIDELCAMKEKARVKVPGLRAGRQCNTESNTTGPKSTRAI